MSDFKYGNEEAIKIAAMFGLRDLIDPQSGRAKIKMKIKTPTFFQNKQNKGAQKYQSLNLNEGDGVTGTQELGKLKNLLYLKDEIKKALVVFSNTKTENIQEQQFMRAKL